MKIRIVKPDAPYWNYIPLTSSSNNQIEGYYERDTVEIDVGKMAKYLASKLDSHYVIVARHISQYLQEKTDGK